MSETRGARGAPRSTMSALADEIERQARSLLGAMRLEGARGLFPMTRQSVRRLVATRLALVGDAAHAFPPIGAQGFNLGLRDIEGLLEAAAGRCATSARRRR